MGEADFREAKRQFEIVYLRRKLEEHHWNVSQTAAEVGLHRQSLQEKLRELGIQRPGKYDERDRFTASQPSSGVYFGGGESSRMGVDKGFWKLPGSR